MNVTSKSIHDRVISVIAETLGVESSIINLQSVIADELASDSLEQAGLFIALEDEFGDRFEDEDTARIRTVQDVVEFLEAKPS